MNIGARIFDALEKILDYIPFVSTVKGIFQLVKSKIEYKSSFVRKEENIARSIVVCIPILGNIAVGIRDFINYRKIRSLIGKTDKRGRLSSSNEQLQRAVELGSGEAAVELALRAEVKNLRGEMYGWSKRGAELGDAKGVALLALCYLDGIGVVKDVQQAFRFAKQSSDREDTHGMLVLGRCYAEGAGVKKDEASAFNLYKKSAERENTDAMASLGYCYEEGVGVKKDEVAAFKLYKESADRENTYGMLALGHSYKAGIGVKKDGAAAFTLYKKSADNENTFGMVGVGICYEKGIGVDQDVSAAFDWYKKSADLRNTEGMRKLAQWYVVVEKNMDKAREWYEKAAVIGDKKAQDWLVYHPKRLTQT